MNGFLTPASYGQKMDLGDFVDTFGPYAIMDRTDPVQVEIGRYVGEEGSIVTMRAFHAKRQAHINRGK